MKKGYTRKVTREVNGVVIPGVEREVNGCTVVAEHTKDIEKAIKNLSFKCPAYSYGVYNSSGHLIGWYRREKWAIDRAKSYPDKSLGD